MYQLMTYRFGKSFFSPLLPVAVIAQPEPVKASSRCCALSMPANANRQIRKMGSRACKSHTNCTSNACRCGKNCISFCAIVRPIISCKLKRTSKTSYLISGEIKVKHYLTGVCPRSSDGMTILMDYGKLIYLRGEGKPLTIKHS